MSDDDIDLLVKKLNVENLRGLETKTDVWMGKNFGAEYVVSFCSVNGSYC